MAKPRLVADFNLNRYHNPTVQNVPSEASAGFDLDNFPLESIAYPNRPTKGVIKALVGQAMVSKGYTSAKDTKFYISDREDKYKYWVSPFPTNASGNFPLHTDGSTVVRPRVMYSSVLKVNKIVIKVENTWASPKNFDIMTQSSVGGSWTTQATNPSINNNGTIVLYFNGTGWTTNKPLTPSVTTADIAGILIRVTSMGPGIDKRGNVTSYKKRVNNSGALQTVATTGGNSNFSLISIEPHFEVDLTSRLESVSDNFDLGETNQFYPIGSITSNQADIVLSNEDGAFNSENTSSIFYKISDGNVQFNLDYIFNIDGVNHVVQQFNMYSLQWLPDVESDSISIILEDSSKFLKEEKPNAMLLENKTVHEIIARILDSVGFVDYNIDESDMATNFKIPVFWTDGEETVWGELDKLARASQTAIYFDGTGTLQIKTRDSAFKSSSAAWNIRGEKFGNELTDLETISREGEFEGNKVNITYKTTKWKTGTNERIPGLSKVWEPTGSVVLSSAPLKSSMNSSQDYFTLTAKAAVTWPYSGMARIDGEVVKFEGKEIEYILPQSQWVNPNTPKRSRKLIKSDEEYQAILRIGEWPEKAVFTGGIKITSRGLWNTEPAAHSVDASGYGCLRETKVSDTQSVIKQTTQGFVHDRSTSTVAINSTSVADLVIPYINSQKNTPFSRYGTRFKFWGDSARTTCRAGLAVQLNGTENNGYFIDVQTSELLTTGDRTVKNEVTIYSKKGTKWHVVKTSAAVAVVKGPYYDLDVFVNRGAGQDRITVWLNGVIVIADAMTNATTTQAASGKMGMYVKGRTLASFQYLYGVSQGGFKDEPLDDYSFYDLKEGGVRSGYYNREIAYKVKTRYRKLPNGRSVAEKYLQNDFFFDEFGPYVHEIREFNVDLDPSPVQYAEIFNTNTSDSAVLEFNSTPFSARFLIANTSRYNAVLNGEDTISTSASNSINQVLTVLGRNLDIADEETIEVKNPSSIRARGAVEMDITNDWIQSKAMAQEVANWIVKHWSLGIEEENVTIFGNPLIELGDMVTITYSRQNMSESTHKYTVVGVSNSFENGIETSLRLRRIRVADPALLN